MRRFPSSWDKTLAALGFRRNVKRIKREWHRRKASRLETLERREMLAGDTPTVLRPEYVLVGQADGSELSPFVVSTEYAADDSASAVVTLDESLGQPDYGVQELTLELRLGDSVLESQQITINLAREEFSDAFYRDRVRLVSGQVRSALVEQMEAWRDELGLDGVFTTVGDSVVATDLDDPLLESAERLATMASQHWHYGALLVEPADRHAFYAGVSRVAAAAEGIEDAGRAEAVRTELGRTALLAGKQLGRDLAVGGALAGDALGARDAMLAVVSPYYTVLGPYGVNTELASSDDGALVESAVAVVEQGVFELDDRLRVELGTHNAFVGATITPTGQAASTSALMAALSGSDVIDGAWHTIGGGTGYDGSTFTAITDAQGDVTQHGIVRFDLGSEQGRVPTSAVFTLTESVGATNDGVVQLRNGLFGWDNDFDEDDSDWNDFEQQYFAELITSTANASDEYTFDVTEAVQRSLLLGDANADGLVDHDYQGTLQRRELAADVNAAYLAIRDWDGYRDRFAGLEVVPGDLLYRVDANWDGVASAADGRVILDRLGVAGGDFDLDGDVDVADLAAYQANYGKVAHQFADGDADFNGVVNAYDHDIWDAFDASALAYKDATPHFELSLPDAGAIDFHSQQMANGPQLDLTYEADVEITDVHAYGTDPITGDATGQVVVEYRALHENMATGAKAQIYRVPASGGPMTSLGVEASLSNLPLAGGSGSHTFPASDVSGLQPGESIAVRVWNDTVGSEFSHTRMLTYGAVYDGAHNAHLFGEGLRETATLGDGYLTLSNPAAPSLTLYAASHFENVDVALAGGDDDIWLRPDFTETATVDGGAGDDQIDVQMNLGGGATIDLRDEQGANDAHFWINGSLSLVNAGDHLDPSKRGPQTLSLDYVNDEYENEPQWGVSGHAGVFEITLASNFSLRHIQGLSHSLLAPASLLVDTLHDIDNDDFSKGDLSLREALRLADVLPGKQTIEFDPGLFGPSQETIRLTSGSAGLNDYVPRSHWGVNDLKADLPQPFRIRSEVDLNGPGAELLALDAWDQSRVFTIDTTADVAIRDLTVTGGYVEGTSLGGALYADEAGDLLLERTVWTGNQAYGSSNNLGGRGGAMAAIETNVHIVDSLFQENDARYGGAIYFRPDTDELLHVEGSTFTGNTASKRTHGGYGSAINVYTFSNNAGDVRIDGSTFSGNWSKYAGTIQFQGHQTTSALRAEITNSTIAHNTADGNGSGGAGLFDGTQGVTTLNNTILADNFENIDANGNDPYDLYYYNKSTTLISGNSNVIGYSRYNAYTVGYLSDANGNIRLPGDKGAGLKPLADNGGFTPTHALEVDSPARDQGNVTLSPVTHDQRGELYGRVRGTAQDIGAYESAIEEDSGALVIRGSELADQILVTPGVVYLGGLSGTPIPFEQNGLPLHVHGGGGNDTITLMPGVTDVTLFGDEGDDTLFGSSGSEVLRGGGGNDQLYGRDGDDFLYGDADEDTLYGGDGDDELYGGDQDDKLFGGAGNDELYGDADNDHLDGGTGSDALYGGGGDDRLVVSGDGGQDIETDDSLRGEGGDDTYVLPDEMSLTEVYASAGQDTFELSQITVDAHLDLGVLNQMQSVASGRSLALIGSAVTRVIGSDHNDTLIGAAAAETLDGRGGNDTLIGGGGNDHLLGGYGDDQLLGWDATPNGDEALIYDGGYDDDTYWITDTLTANTTLKIRDAEGDDWIKAGGLGANDTIDAVEWTATHGVTVDLSDNKPQVLYDNGAHTFTLDLPGEELIENVAGTNQADVLAGNSLANTLNGFGGANRFIDVESNDTQSGTLASDLPPLVITSLREWDTTTPLTIEIDLGEPSPAAIQSLVVIGALASDTTVSGSGATRSVAFGGVQPVGVYPLTIRVTTDDGREGIVLVDAKIGSPSAAGAAPNVTSPDEAVQDTADPRTYSYAFEVTDADVVRLAGDLPPSLQTAYDADPDAVLIKGASIADGFSYQLKWSTEREDVGDHSFRIEATDAGLTPRRYSLPVTIAVPEYDEPASVKRVTPNGAFAVDFSYARTVAGASGEADHRSDPSFDVTLVNDDGFDDVRIVVDWTYDDADGFQADQVVYGRGEDIEGEEWTKRVTPRSHGHFSGSIYADTKVAFRVEEYRPDDPNADSGGYVAVIDDQPNSANNTQTISSAIFSSDSSNNQLEYRPVETKSLKFASWELADDNSYDPTDGFASTNVTIVGSLTNQNASGDAVASVEGLVIHFYKIDENGVLDDEWIGVTTTDENGAFEFAARGAFDLDDFTQDQTATIRAKVQDPAPVLPPAYPSDDSGLLTTADIDLIDAVDRGEQFTLEVPESPAFAELNGTGSQVYLVYEDTPRLEGLGFVRQPKISGQLTSTNTPVDGLTVRFNLGDSTHSIAISDAQGNFDFLPPISLGTHYSITADIATWDDFRQRALDTESRTIAIDPNNTDYQPGDYAAPAIAVGFTDDGSAYVPTVSGSIDVPSDNKSRVLVEFSRDSSFEAILAETLTEIDGSFSHRFTDLPPGTHTIYARSVGWNHWADAGNELVVGAVSQTDVTISAISPTPVLDHLVLANDTGPNGDGKSADPTLKGLVQYAGDMLDVQIQFDLNGDGRADEIVLPNVDGSFYFTPSGLAPGDMLTVTAWAVAPELGDDLTFDLDPALQEILDDGPLYGPIDNGGANTIGWSDEQLSDESAQAWFDELFQSDAKLGGAWYEADFAPDWKKEHRSNEISETITFLDPTGLPYAVTGVNASSGTTFSAQVTSEREVGDLLLEVYINRGDAATPEWELDGRTRTDETGGFTYTPHTLSKTSDNLKVILHKPVYDNPFAASTEEFFFDPYGGVDVAHDVALDALELTADASDNLVDHATAAPILRDRIANDSDPDFNPAGWIVEFDVNADGRPDIFVFTDADGYYEYDFTDLLSEGAVLLSVRVVQESWNDQENAAYRSHSSWEGVASWAAIENALPVIERFELLNDTGVAGGALNERVLDRVTTDPTVIGRIVKASSNTSVAFSYATVEFSHRGDGVVDGIATTDASGRFEYLPEGLDVGFWDLRARVIEANGVDSSGWQSLTATGDPATVANDGTPVGFQLIDPTPATVSQFNLLNEVDNPGVDPQLDARLFMKVDDVDSVDNLLVDIFELRDTDGDGQENDRVLIATTALEPDGTAEVIPIGMTLGEQVTLVAVPRELNPYTGQPVPTLPASDPNANEAELLVDVAATSNAVPYLFSLHDSSVAAIEPTVYGHFSPPTTTEFGFIVHAMTPLEAVLEITYVTDLGLPTEEKETLPPVSVSYQIDEDGEFGYAYTPDLSRWADGLPSNIDVEVRVRGVASKDGAVVMGDWNGTKINILGSNLTRPQANLRLEARYDDGVEADLGSTTVGQKTLAAVMTASFATTLETLDDTNAPGDGEVRVDARYIEVSTNNTPAGEVEFVVAVDEDGSVDLSEFDLGYGALTLQVRLIEEAVVDADWPDTQAHKDRYESGATRRVAGDWETIQFTLVDPRPGIEAASLDLVDGHTPDGLTVPEAVEPIVGGSITSALYETDDLGGLTVEYDLNGDGLAEGSTLTYADGSFDFRPSTLTTGEHTIQVRVVDPYGGEETLEGDWEAFTFKRVDVLAPGFMTNNEPALESSTNDPVNGDVSYSPVLIGRVDVGDTLTLGLDDLTVEFDFNGDGYADDSAEVDVDDPLAADHGAFSFDASDVAYGEASIRVRTAAWNGAVRVYGDWTAPIDFFHASEDAPAVEIDTLASDFDTTGVVSGRATIGGFGANVTIEVVTVSGPVGSEVEHTSYARTDDNGVFSVVPPRLKNAPDGTHTIRVRATTTIGGKAVPGQWNELSSLPSLNLPTPLTPLWETGSFKAAYPDTLVGGSYGDPTIEGSFGSHYSGAVVEIDYDNDSTADATVTLDGDGSFTHVPVGLTPNQAYTVRARWSRWNPTSGQQATGMWEPLVGGSLTFDPTVGGAPQVTSLQLSPIATGSAAVATDLTPFIGQVTGNGHVAGLTVWFDHDGDGVADGKTFTHTDGHFTYHAQGISTEAGAQTLTAWVDPPEYSQVTPTAAFNLPFTLTAAPSIASVVYRVDPLERITGQVAWDGERANEVEYWFLDSSTGVVWAGPTATDLSSAELASERAAVTEEGRFFFDVPAGATTLMVRAVAGDAVGRWKQLTLTAKRSEHALPISEVGPLYPDANDANQSADPTLRGKVSGLGEGAFAVVQVLRQDPNNGNAYVPIGRVTADARGEFLYTLPSDSVVDTPYNLKFRTVAWDAASQSEATGEETNTTFTWLTGAPIISSLVWAETDSVSGPVDNPTVVGTVTGAGRKAGVRVEFNHGDGQSVDGFAYTDANGEFRYTPLVSTGQLTGSTLTLTARAVAWDVAGGDETPEAAFTAHATEDSVTQISATLNTTAPDSVSPHEFTDLTNDEIALVGLKDAVFASLADLGFAGDDGDPDTIDETIDVGFGDVALLHRGGGEGEFDQSAFTPETAGYDVPVTSSTDNDYHLITPSGVLSGSYVITVNTSDNGSGHIESASEISFELIIDSYVTNVDEDTTGDAGLYDKSSTRLELSGSYTFTFSTAAAATYNSGVLASVDHYITEEVDYDYVILDAASTDGAPTFTDPAAGTTSAGARPIDSRFIASGGSEYTFNLGDADQSNPASYDTANSNAYNASIRHEETTRINGYGDAAGPVANDSDGGLTVDRTYTETIVKGGSFAGADSPSGTISVSIAERIVTKTDTESRVAEGGEQSFESVDSTQVVRRNYTGSASYTAGDSISGSGTLTETFTYEATVNGRGSAVTGDPSTNTSHQTDRWDYEGEAQASSTFTIGGSFSESLDPASPGESSSYSGSHSFSSNSKWEGKFSSFGKTYETDDDNDDSNNAEIASTDVGGGERMTRTSSTSGDFSGYARNQTSRLEGEYVSRGTGFVKEWSEGRVTDKSDDHSNTTDFRSHTVGDATPSSTVTYSSSFSPEAGEISRENVDYEVIASGDSFSATQNRGHRELGDDENGDDQGRLGYFSRVTTDGSIDIENKGQSTQGVGSLEETPFTPTDSGYVDLETDSNVKSMSSAWTRDSAGMTTSTFNDDFEQLSFYDNEETDATFKRVVTTSGRQHDAAFRGTLAEEHEPGTFPEEPTEEDFEGSFSGGRRGFDVKTTTQGSYSTGGPDGRTEDISVVVKDNRGGKRKSTIGRGASGKSSYETNGDHEDNNNGGSSTGAGGASGGSHSDGDGRGDSTVKSSNKSRSGSGPNRSSSGGKSRSSSLSDYAGGHTNNEPKTGHNNRSGDGKSSGDYLSSSTSRDGAVVSSSTSSGDSSSEGDSFSRANGVPTDVSVRSGQNGEGDSSSSSGSSQHGPGFSSWATNESSGEGDAGSGGSASIVDYEVRPEGSDWNDSSEGESTTEWGSETYGADGSYSKGGGDTTTGGDRGGSGGSDPDGSDATANRSSDGESNAWSDTLQVFLISGRLTTNTINTTHEAKGDDSANVSLEDDEVTSSGGSSNNGGENQEVLTSESKGPGYEYNSTNTYTTNSTQSDGKTTGTDKHEWESSSSASSYIVDNIFDNDPTFPTLSTHLIWTVDSAWSNGVASETVTSGPEKSSATVKHNSKSGGDSTKTEFISYEELAWTGASDGVTTHRAGYAQTANSTYTSSHDVGPHGATGGSFNSTNTHTNTSYDNRDNEDAFNFEDDHSWSANDPAERWTTNSSTKTTGFSLSTVTESGSYQDTATGREQTGSYSSFGLTIIGTHTEGESDRPAGGNLHTYQKDGSHGNSTVRIVTGEGDYSPTSNSSSSNSSSWYNSYKDHDNKSPDGPQYSKGDGTKWVHYENGVATGGNDKGYIELYDVGSPNNTLRNDWDNPVDANGETIRPPVNKGSGVKGIGELVFGANGVFAPKSGDSQWWGGLKAAAGSLLKDGAEIAVGEVPIVGDLVAANEAINDSNLYGEQVGMAGRVAAAVSLIPGGKVATKAAEGLGAAARGLGGLFSSLTRRSDDAADAIRRGNGEINVIQPGGGCFTGDTPVSTPEGLRSISALRAGDTVLAYDHDSGGWSLRSVTAVHESLYEDSLVTVTTDDGPFRATVHHPVWVVAGRELAERPVCTELSPGENEGGSLAGRWVNSHDLRPGDVLIDRHGDQRTVLRTEQAFVSAEPVFNLTVEGLHTYAVGEIGLLVHNACAKPQVAGVGKVDGVDAPEGTTLRGPNLGQQQGRQGRVDQLRDYEFDPSQPKHVRGWLKNERRRGGAPRTPPGFVQAHGRNTPAREGFDYSNTRLQNEGLNKLEESVRRRTGSP
ncbi:Bifunctional hemolysin/adenylate cyclase precursor [Planctomycetes bacterium MalM25]|nr:Bifunctional hemolysin/adenylate cyclase precursor [Planctomycetes bacterium MalM25]